MKRSLPRRRPARPEEYGTATRGCAGPHRLSGRARRRRRPTGAETRAGEFCRVLPGLRPHGVVVGRADGVRPRPRVRRVGKGDSRVADDFGEAAPFAADGQCAAHDDRLRAAHARIRRLAEENPHLRDQIARALDEQHPANDAHQPTTAGRKQPRRRSRSSALGADLVIGRVVPVVPVVSLVSVVAVAQPSEGSSASAHALPCRGSVAVVPSGVPPLPLS